MSYEHRDERDVADAVTNYLTIGDDQIATGHGLVTLHVVHARSSLPDSARLLAKVEDSSDEYEITITARKIRK